MALVFGCEATEPTDSGDPIYRLKCPPCGLNGLPLPAAAAAPGSLHESVLEQHGASMGSSIEPLCDLGTVSAVGCDVSPAWAGWVAVGGHRTDIFRYIVKASVEDTFVVGDPMTGASYPGMFGLAPSAASSPWSATDRETITAALALLTNGVSGVDLCLATPTVDLCPPSDYRYMEMSAAGDLFDGSGRFVVGGPWAPDPQMNARTCSGGAGSCPEIEESLGYHSIGCTYTGVGQRRRATTCTSPLTGRTWTNPVTSFVVVDPGTYYAGYVPPPVFY